MRKMLNFLKKFLQVLSIKSHPSLLMTNSGWPYELLFGVKFLISHPEIAEITVYTQMSAVSAVELEILSCLFRELANHHFCLADTDLVAFIITDHCKSLTRSTFCVISLHFSHFSVPSSFSGKGRCTKGLLAQ